MVSLKAQDNKQARLLVNKALRLEADNARAYHSLGLINLIENNLSGALSALRRAIELDSKFTAAYNNYAIALARSGDSAQALGYLTTALDDKTYLRRANLYYNYALIVREYDATRALAHLQKAIASDTRQAQFYLALSAILLQLQQLDQAWIQISKYHQLLKDTPQTPSAHALWLSYYLAKNLEMNAQTDMYSQHLIQHYPNFNQQGSKQKYLQHILSLEVI